MSGNIVRVLDHGVITVPRGLLIPPPALKPTASPDSELCGVPCHTVLIETGDGKRILYDCAMSKNFLEEWPKAWLEKVDYTFTPEQDSRPF